jgi:hypothetical protein
MLTGCTYFIPTRNFFEADRADVEGTSISGGHDYPAVADLACLFFRLQLSVINYLLCESISHLECFVISHFLLPGSLGSII